MIHWTFTAGNLTTKDELPNFILSPLMANMNRLSYWNGIAG